MKKILIVTVTFIAFVFNGQAQIITNKQYSKADTLEQILQRYAKRGVPGIAMAVYSNEGLWSGAAGYASLEDKKPMSVDNLQYLQSVSKMYMAVVILQLHEMGKINLDTAITAYLPPAYSSCIAGADKITVRNLLNHQSGIAEYTDDKYYLAYALQHTLHKFTTFEFLSYVKGKPSQFTPGSKYAYRNTNYELLGAIADVITGDHAKFMQEHIFKPLHLNNTFYRNDDIVHNPLMTNNYWDRFGNGELENVTASQRINVSSMIGDDGIVVSPSDAVVFLKELFAGKLLNQASMHEMMTWVKDAQGNDKYGMGMFTWNENGVQFYGHGGGGIGAGCGLQYYPSKNIYVYYAVNFGVVMDCPLLAVAEELKKEILTTLLN